MLSASSIICFSPPGNLPNGCESKDKKRLGEPVSSNNPLLVNRSLLENLLSHKMIFSSRVSSVNSLSSAFYVNVTNVEAFCPLGILSILT